MNDPRLIPFREYMRRSRPWWWWLNPWGYADALEIIQAEAFRAAAGPETPPPTSDAVREAAEVVRTILTAHDARLSESGVLTYGPPSKGTGFVAAIQWLRRYDAARGGE